MFNQPTYYSSSICTQRSNKTKQKVYVHIWKNSSRKILNPNTRNQPSKK